MFSNSDIVGKVKAFFDISNDQEIPLEKIQEVKAMIWSLKKANGASLAKERRAPKEIGPVVKSAAQSIGQKRESPIEEILLLAMNARSVLIGRVKTQIEVGPYRLDFAFPSIKLCVEADGRPYHSEPAQVARDQRRDAYLSKLGWTVARFTGSEIRKNLSRCIDRITRLYEQLSHKKEIPEAWEDGR